LYQDSRRLLEKDEKVSPARKQTFLDHVDRCQELQFSTEPTTTTLDRLCPTVVDANASHGSVMTSAQSNSASLLSPPAADWLGQLARYRAWLLLLLALLLYAWWRRRVTRIVYTALGKFPFALFAPLKRHVHQFTQMALSSGWGRIFL